MLDDWRFWIVIVILVLVFAWIYTKLVGATSLETFDLSTDSFDLSTESFECEYSVCAESLPLSVRNAVPDLEIATTTFDADLSPVPFAPTIPDYIIGDMYRPVGYRKTSTRSKGETICKAAAEKIYGVPFATVRPPWLRNPETGRCLEIDVYNESLKIGIEYHGAQHYKYTPRFHRKGYGDFISQVKRDNLKLDICDTNGVYIITVPYNCPEDKIESYIRHWDPHAVMLRQNRQTQMSLTGSVETQDNIAIYSKQ